MPRLAFQLTDAELAALKQGAQAQHRTVSNLVGVIVESYLAANREALRNGGKVPKGKGRAE